MTKPPSKPNLDALLEHGGWVRALARSLVSDVAAAEDVEQKTWLSALEHSPPAIRNPRAWLASVVRNTAGMHRREQRARRRREEIVGHNRGLEESQNASEARPDSLVERMETFRKIAVALDEMDEPYGTILYLRYCEELTLGKIAARFNVSESTVHSRIHAGLRVLRKQLASGMGEGWRSRCLVFAVPLNQTTTGGLTTIIAMTLKTKVFLAAGLALLSLLIFDSWQPTKSSTNNPPQSHLAESEELNLQEIVNSELPSIISRVAASPEISTALLDTEVATNTISGIVTTQSRPCEGALVFYGGTSTLTDANGFFSLLMVDGVQKLEVSKSGWSNYETKLGNESFLSIGLVPKFNLALDFSPIQSSGPKELHYRVLRLGSASGRSNTVIREGIARGEPRLLFPEIDAESDIIYMFLAEVRCGDDLWYGHFSPRLREYEEAPGVPFLQSVLQLSKSGLAPPIQVQFFQHDGTPVANAVVDLPSAPTFPRVWESFTTSNQGIVNLGSVMESAALLAVVHVAPSTYACAQYATVVEAKPHFYEVHLPPPGLEVHVSGVLSEGEWVEVRQFGVRVQEGDTLDSVERASVRYSGFNAEWTRVPLNKDVILKKGWLSNDSEIRARIMPLGIEFADILIGPEEKHTDLVIPELFDIQIHLEGVPLSTNGIRIVGQEDNYRQPLFRLSATGQEDMIQCRLPRGELQLVAYDCVSGHELASTSLIDVPSIREVELVFSGSSQLFLSMGGKAIGQTAIIYPAGSGKSYAASVSTNGLANMPGFAPGGVMYVLPQNNGPSLSKMNSSGLLLLGFQSVSYSVRGKEVSLDIPTGFLRISNDSVSAQHVIIEHRKSPVHSVDFLLPANHQFEVAIPIGEYSVNLDSHEQIVEISLGEVFQF